MLMKKKNLLKNTLASTAFWTINKKLAKHVGYLPAVLLQHFIEIRSYENMPDEFYQQKERILDDLGFTRRSFDKSLKTLVDLKFVSVIIKGMPVKNYYTIIDENIVDFLNEEEAVTDKSVQNVLGTKCTDLRLHVTDRSVQNVPRNTNKQIKKIKNKKTSALDTLRAQARSNTQECASAEYSPQAGSSSLEAKASQLEDIDIDLENIVKDESRIENNVTNASSRELKPNTQDNSIKSIDSSMTACVTKHKDILDGHEKTCYVARVKAARVEHIGQLIKDNDSRLKEYDFYIPIDQLNSLTPDNLQVSLFNFKYSNYARSLLYDKKLLIKSISIAFQDNQQNVKFSKFIS